MRTLIVCLLVALAVPAGAAAGTTQRSLIQDDLSCCSRAPRRGSARSTTSPRSAPTACGHWRCGARSPRASGREASIRPIRPTTRRVAGTRSTASSAGSPRARLRSPALRLPAHAVVGLRMQAPPRCVRARRGRVRPFRACPGHALLRRLPGRGRGPRRAAEGRAVVVLQRAQPAGLATAAVRAPERHRLRGGGRAIPLAGPRGHRRPQGDRPRRDEMLLGETSPIGRTTGALATRSVAPKPFLRTLLCLGARSGEAAALRGCVRPRRLRVTGFAHHPYSRGGSRPPSRKGNPATEITLASAGRLERLLDAAAEEGRLPRRSPRPLHGVRLPERSARRPPRASRSHARRSTSTRPTGSRSATRGSAPWRSTS